MKSETTPIRSTIVWGLIGGLFYFPLCRAFSLLIYWPLNIQLTFWILLSGYAVLLARWASRPLKSIGLPLSLLLPAVFLIESATAFLFSVFLTLGWIRSGICFKSTPAMKRLAVETALGLGSGLLVFGALPGVTAVWALGVWLFFLIQALYFVVFGYQTDGRASIEADPFEKAKMAAEKILSGGAFY